MAAFPKLESHLNLKLMERTPVGIHATPAGEVIYRDAKFMINYSKKSITAANAATHTYDTTFCVGTSLLNPAKPFMDLWYHINQSFPDYKLHLVPLEDTPLSFMIYPYLTVVRKPAMFCLQLNAGRRFIPALYLFRSIGITVFPMDYFTAFMHRRMS